MLNARFRIGPSGNVVVSRDMLAGAVNAAAAPLTNRAAISRPGLLTRPPKTETSANTADAPGCARSPAACHDVRRGQ